MDCSILHCVCRYVNTEYELMTGPTHPLENARSMLVSCSGMMSLIDSDHRMQRNSS
jgi:hypothetical protein